MRAMYSLLTPWRCRLCLVCTAVTGRSYLMSTPFKTLYRRPGERYRAIDTSWLVLYHSQVLNLFETISYHGIILSPIQTSTRDDKLKVKEGCDTQDRSHVESKTASSIRSPAVKQTSSSSPSWCFANGCFPDLADSSSRQGVRLYDQSKEPRKTILNTLSLQDQSFSLDTPTNYCKTHLLHALSCSQVR